MLQTDLRGHTSSLGSLHRDSSVPTDHPAIQLRISLNLKPQGGFLKHDPAAVPPHRLQPSLIFKHPGDLLARHIRVIRVCQETRDSRPEQLRQTVESLHQEFGPLLSASPGFPSRQPLTHCNSSTNGGPARKSPAILRDGVFPCRRSHRRWSRSRRRRSGSPA